MCVKAGDWFGQVKKKNNNDSCRRVTGEQQLTTHNGTTTRLSDASQAGGTCLLAFYLQVWPVVVQISLSFLWEKSPNGNTASNLWLKFSFSSKRIHQTSTLLGEERVFTSLSTSYSLNDPVQNRRQLMRTLTESVWGLAASVATLQKWGKKKTETSRCVINAHGESSAPICNEEYKIRRKIPTKHNQPPNNEIAQKAKREIPSSINGPWIAPVLLPLLLSPLLPPNSNLALCFSQCCCWSGMVFGTYQHGPDTYQSVFFCFWPCLPRQGYCV